MESVSRHTSGTGGAAPDGVGEPIGGDSGTADSIGQPTKPTPLAADGPERFAPGGGMSALFNVSSSPTEGTLEPEEQSATEMATARARQRQDLEARQAGLKLLGFGFAFPDVTAIFSRRRESRDALGVFHKLPQLCEVLGIGGPSHDPEVADRHDLWRAELIDLAAKGGPDALDALKKAYVSPARLDVPQLCALLTELAAFGHSYMDLAAIASRDAYSLPRLRDLDRVLARTFSEEELPRRIKQVDMLAARGGVAAISDLLAKGGPDAMDALEKAHSTTGAGVWDLYDLLSELGAFGHSYKNLADIASRNPNGLLMLRNFDRLFAETFSDEELPLRIKQLDTLVSGGRASALIALGSVLPPRSDSPGAFEAKLRAALNSVTAELRKDGAI